MTEYIEREAISEEKGGLKMDVREKLVELLTEYFGVDPAYYGIEAAHLADHLIAHGVTVMTEKEN